MMLSFASFSQSRISKPVRSEVSNEVVQMYTSKIVGMLVRELSCVVVARDELGGVLIDYLVLMRDREPSA